MSGSQVFIANWKMNVPALPAWVRDVSQAMLGREASVVLCPPFTRLSAAQMVLTDTGIALGAQDCHAAEQGAFTGDVSALMLRQVGCTHVIVGHSERRAQHHESDAVVRAKVAAALAHGLTPVLCIGESLEVREAGKAEEVVTKQLLDCLPDSDDDDDIIIAYEPIWAIGTGKTPAPDDIEAIHGVIKKQLHKPCALVYGGSVNIGNAADILALPSVDGVLVGGASLDAAQFATILKAGT